MPSALWSVSPFFPYLLQQYTGRKRGLKQNQHVKRSQRGNPVNATIWLFINERPKKEV